MAQFGGMTAIISYNGIVFDERTETVGISARPHYDAAGRTVTYVVHSITLKTIITTSSTTLDSAMATIRQKLLVPGKPFYYSAAGYGSMAINVTSAATDVVWGPRPQELSYRPIGVKAAEIIWRVEVAIPECANARTSGAIMEFNYTLAIDQDRAGFTTRTYQGYVVIPMTRNLSGDRRLTDSADSYWEGVLPALPSGFQRDSKNRTLDEAKSKMAFTVVDSEMGPNILPVGVVSCKASHGIESTNQGLQQWMGRISAEYEISRDFSPPKCYEHFIKLVRQRLAETKRLSQPIANNPPGAFNIDSNKNVGAFIPLAFSMEEPDIYGRPSARFSLRYLLAQPFKNILKASSLWMPVDNDWNAWRASLSNSALNPRGNAGMTFNPRDDAILDLCIGARTVTMATESNVPGGVRTLVGEDLADACPKPADSWIVYDLWIEVESEDRTMIHKPLAATAYSEDGVGSGYSAQIDAPADIIQRRTSNSDVVYLCGRAARVCYDIVPPRLRSIGDREAELANRSDREFFRQWVVGKVTHTVLGATWRQRYILKAERKQVALSSTGVRSFGTPVAPREVALTTWPVQVPTMVTNDAIDD